MKCAPGLDFDRAGLGPARWRSVSLDGGVREACLWSPGLADPGVRRRATVLRPTDGHGRSPTPNRTKSRSASPGEWIIDPDGAVVRAGLVRHYGRGTGCGSWTRGSPT